MIFDAHLDLSLNAIEFNRDLRCTVEEIRAEEKGMEGKGRACGTVAFPEMREAGMGIVVATQIAGCMKPGMVASGWNSPQQAWAMTQAQLAWYKEMEDVGEMRMLSDLAAFEDQLALWSQDEVPANAPIGYILSLEGADSIITPKHLERSWQGGLRVMGPAHYGEGRYAFGHDRTGKLKPGGVELVEEMDRLGMILDVTHLCDDTFWQCLDIFDGSVWASHSNCRALVNDPRQFSDEQIKALIERGAVIGAVFDTWMLVSSWVREVSTPESAGVKIEAAVEHIDHICQLAGNANHCGLGSDLDGGFGKEQCPMDLDTIADLTRLAELLSNRGFSENDVDAVMSGNFVKLVKEAWA